MPQNHMKTTTSFSSGGGCSIKKVHNSPLFISVIIYREYWNRNQVDLNWVLDDDSDEDAGLIRVIDSRFA